MQHLNPSEISELIKSRITDLNASVEARNEGTIVSVSDGIVRIHGLPDLATNLMTMTLTAFVSETILLGRAHQRWRRRLLSIGLFVASGTLCAVLVTTVNPYAGLVLALLLLTLAIPCLANEKPAHDR